MSYYHLQLSNFTLKSINRNCVTAWQESNISSLSTDRDSLLPRVWLYLLIIVSANLPRSWSIISVNRKVVKWRWNMFLSEMIQGRTRGGEISIFLSLNVPSNEKNWSVVRKINIAFEVKFEYFYCWWEWSVKIKISSSVRCADWHWLMEN